MKELKTIVIYKEDHEKLLDITAKNKSFRDIIHELLKGKGDPDINIQMKGGFI